MKSAGVLLVLVVPLAACGRVDDPPPQNATYVSWLKRGTSAETAPAAVASTQTTGASLPATALSATPGPMVFSSQPDARSVDDRRLADRIRKALVADPSLKDAELDRVRISTAAGKVTLNGLVPTTAGSTRIEQTVRSLEGVTAVDNQIEVLQ